MAKVELQWIDGDIIGATGLPGALGMTGSMGMTGAMGLTGAEGVTGFMGVTGLMGVTGITGETGVMGLVGATGLQGASGEAVYVTAPQDAFVCQNSTSVSWNKVLPTCPDQEAPFQSWWGPSVAYQQETPIVTDSQFDLTDLVFTATESNRWTFTGAAASTTGDSSTQMAIVRKYVSGDADVYCSDKTGSVTVTLDLNVGDKVFYGTNVDSTVLSTYVFSGHSNEGIKGDSGGGSSDTMDTIEQGIVYTKLTAEDASELIGGGDTALHYHSQDRLWSNIGYTPSTLSGYGITDAYTKGETDILLTPKLESVVADLVTITGTGVEGDPLVAVGVSTTTLQSAYEASANPEINTTNGALTLKNGNVLDITSVLEVANYGGTVLTTIYGNGTIATPAITLNSADLSTTLNGKAPVGHASTSASYGVGDTTKYGHVMMYPGTGTSTTGTMTQAAINTALALKVTANTAITGTTATKITYDTKGLITSSATATTADINPSGDRQYVTLAKLSVLNNTSGTNTGDQTGGTPGLTLGTTNFAGTSPQFIRKDATIMMFDTTLPLANANTAAAGAALVAARRDHVHPQDTSKVGITGNESISGYKTFTDQVLFGGLGNTAAVFTDYSSYNSITPGPSSSYLAYRIVWSTTPGYTKSITLSHTSMNMGQVLFMSFKATYTNTTPGSGSYIFLITYTHFDGNPRETMLSVWAPTSGTYVVMDYIFIRCGSGLKCIGTSYS